MSIAAFLAFGQRLATTPPGGANLIAGAGSTSTSLVSHPKTGQVTDGHIWVDPTAGTNGSGTQGSPYNNLDDALLAVADGERIISRGGNIVLSGTFSRSTSWGNGIEIFAYGSERVTLDCSNLGTSRPFSFSGGAEHWKGFEVTNGDDGAMLITGSNYTIEDFWVHHMGQAGGGGGMFYIYGHTNTGVVIQDSVAYRNGDGASTSTNTPDNFKCHAAYGDSTQVASGHVFARCFSAHGTDDGFDLFYSNGVSILDSVSYRSGYHYNGNAAADGTGFKMGSANAGVGNNTARGNLAIANKNVGVNANGAPLPLTVLFNTVTQDDWRPVRAPVAGSDVRNNIAYANAGVEDVAGDTYNTWNSSADAGGNPDFPISNPLFVNAAGWDFSLGSGSPAIGAASDGGNLGASIAALDLAKEWLAKDLTT